MPFYNTISCQFLSEIKVRVTRNVSFLNIFTNSRNAHPIAKIKLFGSRGESALGGGHKYRPIKSYPLAGWPLAAYEQPKCVRSFLLFSLSFFSPCQPPQNVSSRRLFRIRFGIHSYDVASVPQGIRTFRLLFASSRRSAVLFKLAYSHVPLRGEDRPEK